MTGSWGNGCAWALLAVLLGGCSASPERALDDACDADCDALEDDARATDDADDELDPPDRHEGELDDPGAAPLPTCAHSECTIGPALHPDCNDIAAVACAREPHCCSAWWDAQCVALASGLGSCDVWPGPDDSDPKSP